MPPSASTASAPPLLVRLPSLRSIRPPVKFHLFPSLHLFSTNSFVTPAHSYRATDASVPIGSAIAKEFGMNVDNVVAKAKQVAEYYKGKTVPSRLLRPF